MNNIPLTDSSNHQRECLHGISLDTTCFLCLHSGVYFHKDAEAYQEFYKKSSNVSFDFAFEIAKRVQFWHENTKDNILENYFIGLRKVENLVWSISTIKKAYYLTREFSDLKQVENRKCSFSIYREIANSRISDSQKKDLRSRVEAEQPTLYQTRELIKEVKGQEPTIPGFSPELKEKIIFQDQEDFISKVRVFISKQTDLKEGRPITIKIHKQKERIRK
ncbi:MAG: hypothetical protein HGA87_00525 [Desulfobulbaceae bacterium]|nr:hypothetical protein [Desulfobulbaceae bacterium]